MSIEELFRDTSIDFREHGEHHHCTEGWIQIDCPQCSPNSGNYRLGWNLVGNYFSCWHCGKLPTLATLCDLTKLPPSALHKSISDICLTSPGVSRKRKPPGTLKIPYGVRELMTHHRNYLIARGFSDLTKLEDRWDLAGIGHKNPKFAWDIFIPIKIGGKVISWATRTTGSENHKRYRAAGFDEEAFPAKEVLYGIDYCQHSIMICEGFVDVWKIGPGAVATMGTSYSRAQMLAASRFPNRFLCFDSEPKAQMMALKLCHDLMMFPGRTRMINLNSGKDPGNCDKEELQDLKGLLI